jgi:hypothetical protein
LPFGGNSSGIKTFMHKTRRGAEKLPLFLFFFKKSEKNFAV